MPLISLVTVIFGIQILAALLLAPADFALLLLRDILVDLLAHRLHDIIALLYRVRHLRALRFLEPVALGGILGPNLAAIAILFPEFLTHLLLLVIAFLLELGRIGTFFLMFIMTLILVFLNIFDLLDFLAITVLRLRHSSSYGKTEDKTQSLHLDLGREMRCWRKSVLAVSQ